MGASCSKSSGLGIPPKATEDLRSSTQSINSPYLLSNLSSTKSSKSTKQAGEIVNDLIQAQHQTDPAGQLQNALAASAATAALSEASFSAATAVATAGRPASPLLPNIARQSFQDASAVYGRPLDRPTYHHKAPSSRKSIPSTNSLIRHSSFPEAMKAVSKKPSQERFAQLLQQHLFGKQDIKVRPCSSLAVLAEQSSSPTPEMFNPTAKHLGLLLYALQSSCSAARPILLRADT